MILVTGGGGFIGRYVCSSLSAGGKKVLALDQKSPGAPAGESAYHSLKCDITDKDRLEDVFREHSFTAIIHLASLLNTASREDPRLATVVNVGGSLNIMEAAGRFQVPRVIYGSSISVYGSRCGPDRHGVSETEPAAPEDLYGASKRYVEMLGEARAPQLGIEFIALRIPCVLGPGAVETSSPWRSDIFEKFGLSCKTEVAIPHGRDEALPLVHVEDVADMFVRLAEAEQVSFSVYNAPSETWTLGELARYVESLDGNIRITFGQSAVRGIPGATNGRRFAAEFGYAAVPLKERFRRAAHARRVEATDDDA